MARASVGFVVLLLTASACGGGDSGGGETGQEATPVVFVAMTFNAGTNKLIGHDSGPDDGYTSEHARITDEVYKNNLTWNPAEAALISFVERIAPDVVVFQEMWHDPWCEEIEVDPELDFVCRDYDPGGPSQIERLVGAGYDTVCAPKQLDNCVAVRREFGRIDGGLIHAFDTPGQCSGLGRVAAVDVVIANTEGPRRLKVVNVHARSGITEEDMGCRMAHLQQVFEDFGDGSPAVGEGESLVLGDMNVDPDQWTDFDPSAVYWNERVGQGKPFQSLSDDTPTHHVGTRIDHVIGRGPTGRCLVHGSSDGTEPVMSARYWDHRPVVCEVTLPTQGVPGVQDDEDG